MVVHEGDKHSSLVQAFENYRLEKFYTLAYYKHVKITDLKSFYNIWPLMVVRAGDEHSNLVWAFENYRLYNIWLMMVVRVGDEH
jgi:hypothetical protein